MNIPLEKKKKKRSCECKINSPQKCHRQTKFTGKFLINQVKRKGKKRPRKNKKERKGKLIGTAPKEELILGIVPTSISWPNISKIKEKVLRFYTL